MALQPSDIIRLRGVLRKGILDKTLNELAIAAGEGSIDNQISFLKVLYGQTSQTYTTYAGTMLTQLATLSYLEGRGDAEISANQPLGEIFSVTSQDTLLARRLLLSRVHVPDTKKREIESIDAFIGMSSSRQAEDAARAQREILSLRTELEELKMKLGIKLNENTKDLSGLIIDLKDLLENSRLPKGKGVKKDTSQDNGGVEGMGSDVESTIKHAMDAAEAADSEKKGEDEYGSIIWK